MSKSNPFKWKQFQGDIILLRISLHSGYSFRSKPVFDFVSIRLPVSLKSVAHFAQFGRFSIGS